MDDQQRWRLELKNSDVEVRARAAESLCLAGSESVVAAVDLVVACGDVEDVQNWAAAALEDLGAPPMESVDSLETLVNSPFPLVGYWAATLLGRLGQSANRSQVVLGKPFLILLIFRFESARHGLLARLGQPKIPQSNR